jgi:hypothetical protein
MSFHDAYLLTCDNCGAPRMYHASIPPQEAVVEAQLNGWTLQGDLARCPDCPPQTTYGPR